MFHTVINTAVKKCKINKNIYGHFAEHLGRCIYGGIWVGKDSDIPNTNGMRNDVIEALRQIKIPVLRWPGGCFADEYHWMDGIGDPQKRPTMVNTNWGDVTENNHFGTHEFMEFCEFIGAEPYVCGNVGSGTAREMKEWVEYMTFDGISPMADLRRKNGREKPWKLKYFGVGNENWGCGGSMRPEYYSDVYRRYATFVKDRNIYKIACGPNCGDYNWTEVLMKNIKNNTNAITLHYYTIANESGQGRGSALGFPENQWFSAMKRTLTMNELLTKHINIMDRYDPEKKVDLIVDEWGIWSDVEVGSNPAFLYQQNSLRDAVAASANLNIFNNHAERVSMTNIAQMVNVLQAVILTEGDKMVKTPTYHVFDMYQVHQDATLLGTDILENTEYVFGDEKLESVNISSSVDENGKVHITLSNLNHLESVDCELDVLGIDSKNIKAEIITHDIMDAHNDFENPNIVDIQAFDGVAVRGDKLCLTMPAKSVVCIEI